MTRTFQEIRQWRDVDLGLFRREIAPLNQPAVLKGLVGGWPLVAEGRKSPRALVDYLKRFDRGRPVGELLVERRPPRRGGLAL